MSVKASPLSKHTPLNKENVVHIHNGILLLNIVMSDSLWSNELQLARLLCPPLSPRVCLNSYSLSWWCHPTISSSVVPFSSCLQSLPASGSFPMTWLFTSSGQSIGDSALVSALPMNIQGWFPLRLTALISLLFKGLARVFSSTIWKHQFLGAQSTLWSNSHIRLTTGKTIALTIQTFVNKLMCLLFNTLSRFVIALLPMSKYLLISWLKSPSAVILEPKRVKSVTVFTFSPSVCYEMMESNAIILVFLMLS